MSDKFQFERTQEILVPFEMAADPSDMEIINLTPIQKFYSGSSVFITGATGFLGRILVEKLLRSCPDISTIYILVRSKKGENAEARIKALLDDVIFAGVRQEFSDIESRIVGIDGDCTLPNLGVNEKDLSVLKNEVSVVFHAAASIRLLEKLKMATLTNVKGTQEVLKLCKKMKNLRAVVHVSTAFCNCTEDLISEKFYAPPIDPDKLISLAEMLDDDLMADLTPKLLGRHPNTYTYTKAVAENLVLELGKDLPVAVYRPSIVISSYKEPLKGWVNSLYGPAGVITATASGFLRSLHCDQDVIANVVPVDMAVNALIAIPWEMNDKSQHVQEHEKVRDIPIYQYESSESQPITWGEYVDKTISNGLKWPTMHAIWYYSITLRKCPVMHFLAMLLFHFIPSIFADFCLICLFQKPKYFPMYKKVYNLTSALSYFTNKDMYLKSTRVRGMIQKMSPDDKELFFCDLEKLNWDEYFYAYVLGLRLYLLKNPIRTLRAARGKWARLYWLDQIIKVVIYIFLVRFMLGLMSTTNRLILRTIKMHL